MLAIGKGAKMEIMEQMKMVGVNNILINPVIPDKIICKPHEGEKQQKEVFKRIESCLMWMRCQRNATFSEKESALRYPSIQLQCLNGVKYTAKAGWGCQNDYFYLYNLPLGAAVHVFNNSFQEENGIQVCIIGANIRAKFFSKVDPLGQYIKFNGHMA